MENDVASCNIVAKSTDGILIYFGVLSLGSWRGEPRGAQEIGGNDCLLGGRLMYWPKFFVRDGGVMLLFI